MSNGGASSRRWLLAPIAAVTLALAVVGCGSSEEGPAANVRQHELVTPAEIARYPEGSVERTFLEFWSNLQFNGWANVASYYEPSLRELIGTSRLVAAKKTGASVYPYLRPTITRTKTDDGMTTLFYTLSMEDGTTELASTTWRKIDGNWQLRYDSRLDGELSAVAEEFVALSESKGESVAELPPSPEAVQAGKTAARLQSKHLETELKGKKP